MVSDKKEKILINIAISVVIIILIVIIYLIWSPTFSSNESINTYDSSITYESTMEEYYRSYLNENLKITNFDNLYENINKEYIENSIGEDNKDKLEQYLRDNNLISMNVTIDDVTVSNNGYQYIYRFSYYVHNMKKYVNITEIRPYIFEISFEQSDLSTLNNGNFNFIQDDIYYAFEVLSSNDTSIKYKLTITNNSNHEVIYDFSNLNSIQLINNNRYINMALIANSSTVDYSISPGSYKSIEILFNVPFSEQMNISGFKVNNVTVNGEVGSIELRP